MQLFTVCRSLATVAASATAIFSINSQCIVYTVYLLLMLYSAFYLSFRCSPRSFTMAVRMISFFSILYHWIGLFFKLVFDHFSMILETIVLISSTASHIRAANWKRKKNIKEKHGMALCELVIYCNFYYYCLFRLSKHSIETLKKFF